MFSLVDDGTLDTVVECDFCGGLERFDSDALTPLAEDGYADGGEKYTIEEITFMRIQNAREQAYETHECITEWNGSKEAKLLASLALPSKA